MITVLNMQLLDFDYKIFNALNGLAGKSGVWDAIFVFLSEYVIFVLIAGLAVFVLTKKRDSFGGAKHSAVALQSLAAAFLGRAVFVSLIRIFFNRPRPFVEGIVNQLVAHNPLEPSFPSGHTTVMFALAFSLLFVNRKWGSVYLIIAAVSAFSRVIVGVHFPLDIAGGILVGFIAAILIRRVYLWFLQKHLK